MNIVDAVNTVKRFESNSLTHTLSHLENIFTGMDRRDCLDQIRKGKIDGNLFAAANELKKLAAQINVIIHAVGILTALPHILNDDDQILYLSLGAGNTGRCFDLETNQRIAEFKFINWKGGSEAIRQNSVFKDFFNLAESGSPKRKYLYVLGVEEPLKFFNGKRKISSILSRNVKLSTRFTELYGDKFTYVFEYFRVKESAIEIIDLAKIQFQAK